MIESIPVGDPIDSSIPSNRSIGCRWSRIGRNDSGL